MAITDAAQKNHDALFPNHASTLARTDPELVEVFDDRAFDEVLRGGTLDARTRLMVQLAALIACQAVNEDRVMLGGALNVGVTPVEVKEIVYQSVPYVGTARTFDFLHVTNDVPQLAGHVAGNLAVGNDRRTLLDAATQLLPFIGYPRTLNGIRDIDEDTSA